MLGQKDDRRGGTSDHGKVGWWVTEDDGRTIGQMVGPQDGRTLGRHDGGTMIDEREGRMAGCHTRQHVHSSCLVCSVTL